MRIANRTRSTLLGLRIELAASWWARLRGFLGRPEPVQGEGILLMPCDAVHTIGMSFDLDVIFLDERGRVVDLVRALRPWRWTRRVKGARYVLELPAGTIEMSRTQIGDALTWQDSGPPSGMTPLPVIEWVRPRARSAIPQGTLHDRTRGSYGAIVFSS